jgi:hypothetical protein
MPIFTNVELTQRDRVYLVVGSKGEVPPASALADRVPGDGVRRLDVRTALIDRLGRSATGRLADDDVLALVRDALVRRGVVLFPEFALPLAFFGDIPRAGLWKRLFTEVLDRPGLGVLLLPSDSRLLPPPELCERFASRVRNYLPPPGT